MSRNIVAALALAGCSAQLGDGSQRNSAPDAGTTDSMSQGGGQGATCGNGREVYLAFDGVTLAQGSPSDATQNRVSWMTNATANVPRYRTNDANRNAEVQAIVDGVHTRLQGTPIKVVTQRPAAGPYVMIVFGGTRDIIGTVYSYATNEHDCGDPVKNDVGWVSDVPSVSYAQDLAIGVIGWGLGQNGTDDPADCMCAWANNCSPQPGACRLSPSIASTTSLAPATTCPNQNPQNEVAAFSTQFCQ